MNDRVIGIFGTWRCEPGSALYRDAASCAGVAASLGYTICTGGYSGVMDAAALGAAEHSKPAIGFICPELDLKLQASRHLTQVILCATYVDRLARMMAMCHAFIFMPGRLGTATELALALDLISKDANLGPLILWGDYWLPHLDGLESALTSDLVPGKTPNVNALYAQCRSVQELSTILSSRISTGAPK